ncbi:MAG: glucose-6-phosphate isomerase [Gammaproteobacteria bacterium]|nr:glucose-6-phosphate isomerase [Gammaproteobacteria bacterium]
MKNSTTLPMASSQDWQMLQDNTRDHATAKLSDLLTDPQRTEQLNIAAADIHFDYSRTHLSAGLLEQLTQFARRSGLLEWQEALHSGGVVNPTENQGALHHCYRLEQAQLRRLAADNAQIDDILSAQSKCAEMVSAIRDGRLKPASGKAYRYLLHLGIGGSALGPKLVLQSLSYGRKIPYEVHFVANIDGHCLAPALEACRPDETLVIACSKTFSTLETLRNAAEAIDWMRQGGVDNPLDQFVAVTARPDRAVEFGIDESRILPFPKSIGGRYSVWSAVGLPAMIALGPDTFNEFVAGARRMDEHFFSTPLERNAPVIAGMLDVWYRHCCDLQTIALFCYDQRLDLLVPYCQQLYMESNGKDKDRAGQPLAHASAPVLWGGVGTEVQHAVFQLMHQGTSLHLPDFIAVAKPAHSMKTHHQHLLANFLAQTSALGAGRSQIDGRGAEELDFIDASRLFSGNRPSTSIFLPALDASRLGALLAYYEHRTFVAGVLWGINVYDQMGVELGKEMAQSLFSQLDGDQPKPSTDTADSIDTALAHNLKLLREIS